MKVFVPSFVEGRAAVRLFSAAVVAQVLHYVATIIVMPRLARSNDDRGHFVAWPRSTTFLLIVVASSVVLLVGYVSSFTDARALYGVPAALHAWIEIPLLVLAFSAIAAKRTTPPVPSRS